MYKPKTKFSDLLEYAGAGLAIRCPCALHEHPTISIVMSQNTVQFSTTHIRDSTQGVVLDVDHGAVLPLQIEYHTVSGDKRIERFAPEEFTTFQLKGIQP